MKKTIRKRSKIAKQSKVKARLHRTWVEIDHKAIEKNARTLKALLADGTAMAAVVKSNAYGHGMVESAKSVIRGGATWLAVDDINEALELRKARIKVPIIVLGYTLPELYSVAATKNVSLTISSLESLQNLAKMKLPKKGPKMLRIHLKFETGLNRQGIPESHVQQVIRVISTTGFPAVIEGAYTHFAVMEDPMKQDYSKAQVQAFKNAVAKIQAKGFAPITHASASSGILFSKDFHLDMSRAGIALYGLWPSPEIRKWAESVGVKDDSGKVVISPKLLPALSWKTIVTEVKLALKGAKVGYDLTYELSRNSRLAVIPVGYWHGLPRSMSGTNGAGGAKGGQVLVCGRRANIVGRISMDMTTIDVTDIPAVKSGDEVVIIGRQQRGDDRPDRISAEEAAEKAGTINYEIITRINPLIPRISA